MRMDFFSPPCNDVSSTIGFISMIGKLFEDCRSVINLRVFFFLICVFLTIYLGDKVSFDTEERLSFFFFSVVCSIPLRMGSWDFRVVCRK